MSPSHRPDPPGLDDDGPFVGIHPGETTALAIMLDSASAEATGIKKSLSGIVDDATQAYADLGLRMPYLDDGDVSALIPIATQSPGIATEIRKRVAHLQACVDSGLPIDPSLYFAAETPPDPAKVKDAVDWFHGHVDDSGGFLWQDDSVGISSVLDRLQKLSPSELDAFVNSLSDADLKSLDQHIADDGDDDPTDFANLLLAEVGADTLAKIQKSLPSLQPGIKDGAHYKAFPDVPLFAHDRSGPVEGITGNPGDTAMQQGSGDDCWFMSSISAIAMQNPDFFQNRIIQNPNGTYTVTFYGDDGKPFGITVDNQLPVDGNDQTVYAGITNSGTSEQQNMWVAIYEKAYASVVGDYDEMTAGGDGTGLHILTGQHTDWGLASNGSIDDLEKMLAQGRAVTTTTYPRPLMNLHWFIGVSTAHLVGAHVYAVKEVDRSTHPPTIVLINPWGANANLDTPYETRITEEQWQNDFLSYGYTTIRP